MVLIPSSAARCLRSSDREARGTGTLAGLRAPSFASPGGRDSLRPLCLLVCASQQSRPHASWRQLTRPACPDWCVLIYRRWVLRMGCCTAMICTVPVLLPGRLGAWRTASAGGEGLRQQLRMPCTRAWNCVHHCCDNDWSPCFHLSAGATAQRASVLLDCCGDSTASGVMTPRSHDKVVVNFLVRNGLLLRLLLMGGVVNHAKAGGCCNTVDRHEPCQCR